MTAKSKLPLKQLPQWLIGSAIISIALAGIGYLGQDIWLASTQWLIIAAVLVAFAIYLKIGK